MSDPQLIGHAVQLAAVPVLLKAPRSTGAICGAALLLVLGFFFKHNLIVLPIALAIWLAMEDRTGAFKFVSCGLALLLIGLGVFRLAFGTSLLAQLQSARQYSLAHLLGGLLPWLGWNGAPLVIASFVLAKARREPFTRFCAIYLAVGVFAGAAFWGGAGVDINAMFDAIIALSLVAGFAPTRVRATALRLPVAGAWAFPLAIGLVLSFDSDWLSADYWLYPMQHERQSAASDIALLRSHPGPALCQMLSLCYWADKSAEVDLFNLGQQYATGERNDGDMAELLSDKHFAVIQIDPDGTMALTPSIKTSFDANYRLDHANEDDGAFYVPR
jgi:hypothetical protein